MSNISASEQVKKLQAQLDELRSKAHEELMAKMKAVQAELNDLGFDYKIALAGSKSDKKTSPGKGKQKPGTPCPDCKFATDPPHNGRQHRYQGEDKHKPFTAAELKERGLTKV